MKKHRLTTFQVISVGFLSFILLGTLLLMLPFSSRAQGSVSFGDCLFTATSAVCVTGLVVRDTASTWSPFGQAVILFLIQVGGLGVMTITSFFALFFMGSTSLYNQMLVRDMVSSKSLASLWSHCRTFSVLRRPLNWWVHPRFS